MNYLMHIYLSGENRLVQIGNFAGDAVKGTAYRTYPADMQKGICLHRQIDAFSDAHPLVREAVKMGRSCLGHYASVVTDVFFDHFLAAGFREYAGMGLNCYASGFYIALIRYYRYLPPRFQGFLWHFILTNRLGCYASLTGLQHSLEIMTRYRGLQINPSEAIGFLQAHYIPLQQLFAEFFPVLKEKFRIN